MEHTVFALPFAYVGAFLAVDGMPSAHDLIWITLAMVGARSLAMALNRLIDAGIDARNPRTAGRELPAGALRRPGRRLLRRRRSRSSSSPCGSSTRSSRWLWPIPVVGFVVYPYLKRFTWLCHFWLGAVDGLAPVGAWVAITGQLPWQAWLLGGAVALWVAGFDLFYALFDVEIDRAQGLHSSSRASACAARSSARASLARRRRSRVSSRAGSACRSASLLGRRGERGRAARLRALARAPGRPAAARRGVLHVNGVISVVFFRLRARGTP